LNKTGDSVCNNLN